MKRKTPGMTSNVVSGGSSATIPRPAVAVTSEDDRANRRAITTSHGQSEGYDGIFNGKKSCKSKAQQQRLSIRHLGLASLLPPYAGSTFPVLAATIAISPVASR